ncbi:mechanosensitive ion channel family protein [Ruoffia tabacinasalis]|uniref:Mechanosensitive ion channel n=1 Tax=Ruoffia tabacinasalis TaxID=87458 RepID=A0ABS0LGB5_9LACT|nr:mechanosensitive ion channel domain-containing protein [Ruoffia tabacinasalis]MBG9977169.1 mechanosensitive ion channel [Ruoffia tabacinasalis]
MTYIRDAFRNIFRSIDFQALLEDGLSTVLRIILTVTALWLVRMLVVKIITTYFENTKRFKFYNFSRNNTIQRLLLNIVLYTFYFFVGYSVLSILGIPVGTLVAGAGIASLAVGLGAKDLVSDLVNGLFILIEHQFDVGDHIVINGYEGRIYSIGVRTTVIRDYNGIHHFIPNGNIQELSNLSREAVRIDLDLLIPTDINFAAYEELLKDTYRQVIESDDQINDTTDFIGLMKDKHGRLIYKIRIWVKDADDVVDVEGRYYKLFADALNEAGHPIPMSELSRMNTMVQVEKENADDIFS